MATATTQQTAAGTGDQCVVLRGIGWSGYTRMLRLRGERSLPRMLYLDGDLWLMSPSQPHELWKKRLGTLVTEIVIELGISHLPTSQLTLRRRAGDAGVEGDESYYLANEHRVRGKRIDLRTDPPPDLAIEVVVSHPARRALAVYRRLGVPEVWVGDGAGVTIHRLGPDGRYAECAASAAFPFLAAAEIADWMLRPTDIDETVWARELRRWVQDVLAPRYRGPAAE